jgi:hypothetical protein
MEDKTECPRCMMKITYLCYEYNTKSASGAFSCPVCGRPIAYTIDDADIFLHPELQYTDRYRG